MQNNNVQMPDTNAVRSSDTYEGVNLLSNSNLSITPDRKNILDDMKTHIKIENYIAPGFRRAFYKETGRPRGFTLESFLWYLILQSTIGILCDSTFSFLLTICKELREFCEFESVPDPGKISTFKQTFVEYIGQVFEKFVDVTEPICRELDPKKAGYLIYDPTGVEAYVKENNPKFLNSKINEAKKVAKKNPQINAHSLAYSNMPDVAEANPFVQQQYINGHFCYANKAGIISNGIGIVRHISFFDESFKLKHPEVVSQKTDNPELDKEIGDSTSLKPVLSDFFEAHPDFKENYHTFLGDSSFDSYDNYSMLRNDFKFERMCIPLNPRNSSSAHSDFDIDGTPLCPIDKTPFNFIGLCRGENRSERFKFVCHKSLPVKEFRNGKTFYTRKCTCDIPCTDSSYGRCVYTYPDKDLRLYPGIPRGTEHWNNLYRHRVLIERTIFLLKSPLGGAYRKSLSVRTAKADLFIAGISQLVGLIIAVSTGKRKFFKSVRKLISAS